MATSFPTSLQDLDATRGSAGQPLSSPNHVTHHALEDDTIEAIQTKVGIDSSGDTASLDYKVNVAASTTQVGRVELATDAETITGTDATRVVTPAGLQAKVASDTAKGIVELATDAETITGTDTARAVTPANIQAKVASLTAKGIVELATTAEIDTGTDSTRAIPVDQFVASNRNIRYVLFRCYSSATQWGADGTTSVGGDLVIPFTGTIVDIEADVDTAGTTGTAIVDVNLNGSTIMTTNKLKWDSTEKSTRTYSGTAPGLTTTAVTAGDIITVDIDTNHTTKSTGLTLFLAIKLT